MQKTDDRIWELMSQGDVGAFELLYRKYWPALLDAAFRRLKVQEEAEEVVQEMFADLYARREALPDVDNVGGYLHRAVQFGVYKKIRSYIVHRNYERMALLRLEEGHDGATAKAEQKELHTSLHHAIYRLPDKCREVFLLSREEGLGYRQIAHRLGISPHTVERHISKALKTLREEFSVRE